MPSAPARQSVALAKPLVKRVSFQNVTHDGADLAVPNPVLVMRCVGAVCGHASRRKFSAGFPLWRRRRQAPFSAGFGTEPGPTHVFPAQLPGFFAP